MGEPKWYRVDNVGEFLRSRGRISVGVHSAKHLRGIPWPYCSRCGLLYLKNDVTRAALKKACVVEE